MLLLFACTACDFAFGPEECPYGTRLEYWYTGSVDENKFPDYINNVRQYLFDGEGRLVRTDEFESDRLPLVTMNLMPGNYTVVAWGNIKNESRTGTVVPGETLQKGLMMTCAIDGVPPGFRGNTERLYFGTASFTVPPDGKIRERIYITHCHTALRITVQWVNGKPPAAMKYHMELKGTPSDYGFATGLRLPCPQGGAYNLPVVYERVTNHTTAAECNYGDEVTGELLCYRLTNNSHPLFCLYGDDRALMREIDLKKFLDTLPTDMEHNVEVELELLITIDGDDIHVGLMSGSDWIEGGPLYY